MMSYLLDQKRRASTRQMAALFRRSSFVRRRSRFGSQEGTRFSGARDGPAALEAASQVRGGARDAAKSTRAANLRDFEKRRSSIQGSGVLYVGDHIYGDILRSKKDFDVAHGHDHPESWTVELEALEKPAPFRVRRRQLYDEARTRCSRTSSATSRLCSSRPTGPNHQTLARLRERQGGRQSDARAQIAEHRAGVRRDRDEIHAAFHPYFGSLLKEMNGLEHLRAAGGPVC